MSNTIAVHTEARVQVITLSREEALNAFNDAMYKAVGAQLRRAAEDSDVSVVIITGAGKALLIHLAKIAVANDCGRFEWSVIDWNEPAIKFYQALGAEPQNEWVSYRLTGQALTDLAKS